LLGSGGAVAQQNDLFPPSTANHLPNSTPFLPPVNLEEVIVEAMNVVFRTRMSDRSGTAGPTRRG